MKELNANALGLSWGILSVVCVLLMSLLAMAGMYTTAYANMSVYFWAMDLSIKGTISGFIEAGVMGYVSGYLTAWVYNKFA